MTKVINVFFLTYAFIFYIFTLVFSNWHMFFRRTFDAKPSLTSRAVRTFLDSSLKYAFLGDEFVRKYGKLDRQPPDRILELTGDEVFEIYGSQVYKHDHIPLESQQRGLILPLIEGAIKDFEMKFGKKPESVIEIGIGNGDILAKLSADHPEIHFVGLDMKVDSAKSKHTGRENLEFLGGYPLQVMEGLERKFDIAFFSSTAVKFLPGELRNYFSYLKDANVQYILMNEPTFFDFSFTANDDTTSIFINYDNWFHNFCGYLSEAGFETKTLKRQKYREGYDPGNVHVNLIASERRD